MSISVADFRTAPSSSGKRVGPAASGVNQLLLCCSPFCCSRFGATGACRSASYVDIGRGFRTAPSSSAEAGRSTSVPGAPNPDHQRRGKHENEISGTHTCHGVCHVRHSPDKHALSDWTAAVILECSYAADPEPAAILEAVNDDAKQQPTILEPDVSIVQQHRTAIAQSTAIAESDDSGARTIANHSAQQQHGSVAATIQLDQSAAGCERQRQCR